MSKNIKSKMRDDIIVQMQQYLDNNTLQILDSVLVDMFEEVDMQRRETLPAEIRNSVDEKNKYWAAAVQPGAEWFESMNLQVRLLQVQGAKPGITSNLVDKGVIKINAVIKYPGSKWRIADWIISFFPDHHSYLEPFFGSGAVLFNKPRSHIETVNDLDGDVVNFFEWVKKDPERLAREIYYTPYARQAYEESYNRIPGNSLYKAVNFCIRLEMGHGYRTNGERVGWKNDVQGRERAYAAKHWTELPDRIMQAAERLRGVQIECLPAIDLIQRFNFPNVLIYADPPYMMETRRGKQYRKEMEDKDHEELLEALKAHKGPAIISGYDSKLYRDMLKDWHREEIRNRTQVGSEKREIIWLNFQPEWRQIELFI